MRSAMVGLVCLGLASVAVAERPVAQPASPQEWAVTIRDPYLRGLGVDDVWSAAKSVGISRLEVVLDENLACPHLFEKEPGENGGPVYRIDTPAAREKLNRKLKQEGMSIGCFALGVRLSSPEDEAKALEWVSRAAEAAPGVGCRTLMLPVGITGPKNERIEDEEFVARGRSFVRKLDPIAARANVQITLENLGHYWNRPEILAPVLRESKPDRVGLLHDVCNMYWYGHPLDKLYKLAEQFAPYVRSVHVKSIKYPEDKRQVQRMPGWEYGKYAEPLRTGDIDFAKVLAIYAKAGYVGDVCIEDDSLPHFDATGKKKVIADDVALLNDIIAKLPKASAPKPKAGK